MTIKGKTEKKVKNIRIRSAAEPRGRRRKENVKKKRIRG